MQGLPVALTEFAAIARQGPKESVGSALAEAALMAAAARNCDKVGQLAFLSLSLSQT